jgi:MFS family permease
MIGQERTVLPLLATEVFGLTAFSATLTFIAAFGIVKAATNFFAGTLSDRYGRKPVLIAGWLIGVPVPLLLIWAPTWGWVIFANVLLGVNQGLTWSTTVIMKIDLVGPVQRGLAMGFNEAAGYGAVAATALATGFIASTYGLRPEPFYLGLAYAALGLGVSTLFVRETRGHAHHEAANHAAADHLHGELSTGAVFRLTSVREKALSACSQAGLVNNLNDGLAWGLLPLYFAAAGLSVARIGVLAALYPAVWGLGQLVTGGLSDRVGRKPLIAGGMLVQAGALAVFAAAEGFGRGRPPPCCSGPGPPWSTPRSSPRSATSPTRRGGPDRSGSTGCGATEGSPSARCSPACSPTRTTSAWPSGRSPASPPRRASW